MMCEMAPPLGAGEQQGDAQQDHDQAQEIANHGPTELGPRIFNGFQWVFTSSQAKTSAFHIETSGN